MDELKGVWPNAEGGSNSVEEMKCLQRAVVIEDFDELIAKSWGENIPSSSDGDVAMVSALSSKVEKELGENSRANVILDENRDRIGIHKFSNG